MFVRLWNGDLGGTGRGFVERFEGAINYGSEINFGSEERVRREGDFRFILMDTEGGVSGYGE